MQKLRELRRRRVLSADELAERSGVGRATIFRLEGGKANAHPKTIRKLAEALGVEPAELLKEEG